jgi:molybdopterin-guanine dinucleotide biosynthesis protein A
MAGTPDPALLVAVLNGGASRRFGSDKAAALIGRTTALAHVLSAAAPLTPHVIVIGREAPVSPGVPVFPDSAPGAGPLPALLAAFTVAESVDARRLLALPCDLPRVTSAHLAVLAAPLGAGHQARIPRLGGVDTPLPALYAAEAAEAFRACLSDGLRALIPALARLDTLPLTSEDLSAAGLDPRGLDDFDTPEELAELVQL